MRSIYVRDSGMSGRSTSAYTLMAMISVCLLTFPTSAFATIDNIVTVTGTPLGGPPNSVTATDTESVDVEDASPELTLVKTFVLNDEVVGDNLAEVGETITYTYTVTNSGNVTFNNVTVRDIHEGLLLSPGPAGEVIVTEGPNQPSDIGFPDDGLVSLLDVGAVAAFTITLPVTQEEVDNQ